MRCGECKWWDKDLWTGDTDGGCKRYPPSTIVDRADVLNSGREHQFDHITWFPRTEAEWWCGEFSERT